MLKLIAKTSYGFEPLLEKELLDLGAKQVKPGNRVVEFSGNKKLVYKANMGLKTCLAILQPLKSFRVHDENDLYKKVKEIKWENYFDLSNTFSVNYTVNSKKFTHSQYAALKLKDAVCDRFRDLKGERPSVDTMDPEFKIDLHINNKNMCTVSFDSSGESLFKRGYKTATHKAPLKEDLAAAMLILSGWDKKTTLIDPMCGSGTILCEAYLMGRNIPPNYFRKNFGFQNWGNYDPELFEEVKKEFESDFKELECHMYGWDISGRSLRATRENLQNIEALQSVRTSKKDFFNSKAPEEEGMLIFNPPYGRRIGDMDPHAFYAEVGDTLKNKYPGYTAWILSCNLEAFKDLGLKTDEKNKLFNANLECRFVKFKIFKGNLKDHKTK